MKNFWYLISLLFLLGACQTIPEEGFVINGQVFDSEEGEVILLRRNPETWLTDTITSAEVKDGKFTLEGELDSPSICYLRFVVKVNYKDKDGVTQSTRIASTDAVVLENKSFNYEGWVRDFSTRIFIGGELHEKVYQLERENEDLYNLKRKYESIMTYARVQKMDGIPQSEINVYVAEYQNAFKDYREALGEYVSGLLSDDISTLHKVLLLEANGLDNSPGDKFISDIMDRMETDFGANYYHLRYLKSLKSKEDNINKTNIGKPFLSVESNDLSGEIFSLSSVVAENKVVLLEFWASWCNPCLKEFPIMKAAYSKFHSKGFEIYGISIDKKSEDWKRASDQVQLPWINTHILSNPNKNAQNVYGISAIPANFLIGKEGKIIAKNLRGEALEKKLTEILEQ